ncbi:RNA-guided endonuclease InsQ/TnpB family protein [Deinococcus sp. ME38]|uniref:RNA-guided endonuclease InsQ/TnpB family protein n=1 Tax=Deinococcus sp. ME38 TaxID=3400344 RepID=UPI003B596421
MSLYVVRKLDLPASPLLDHLARAAGELYSRTVVAYWRILRKTGTGKNGRKPVFLSQYDMERICISPDLHAHTSDAVVGNFYASIKSANARKKKGSKEAKYPRRHKRFFKITWKSAGIRLKKGQLILSNGKRNEPLVIPWAFDLPRQVEIGWKKTGGYELRATYVGVSPRPALGDGVAAVDQGELRTATVYDGEQTTLYSGRLIRSKSRYRAKTIARLDANISKTKRGSQRRKKLVRAKRRTVGKLDRQIQDILHKQTQHLVSTLHQRGVQTVVIGDIRDIRSSIKYGAKTNQKLHGWSFGRFRQMVTYKGARLGMQTVLMDEAYTSQTCPGCGERHKPRGRTYRCGCGFVCDRDGVGAMNIRAKYLGHFGAPVVGVMAPPLLGVRFRPHLSHVASASC